MAVVNKSLVKGDEVISVSKDVNPKSPNYRKWYLLRQVVGSYCMLDIVEVLFISDTRKEAINYADKLGLEINFIDSGRLPSGCKW